MHLSTLRQLPVVLARSHAQEGARGLSPRVQSESHVAASARMGLGELLNAWGGPSSSMAKSSPPSVLVQSPLGLATRYYLGFHSQVFGEYLLLPPAVDHCMRGQELYQRSSSIQKSLDQGGYMVFH